MVGDAAWLCNDNAVSCSQRFQGAYDFNFEFGKQPKDTKSAAWTVSVIRV